MTRSDEKVEVQVSILNETDKALLVSTSSPLRGSWVPLSLVEVDRDPHTTHATITLPEWLAVREGLV